MRSEATQVSLGMLASLAQKPSLTNDVRNKIAGSALVLDREITKLETVTEQLMDSRVKLFKMGQEDASLQEPINVILEELDKLAKKLGDNRSLALVLDEQLNGQQGWSLEDSADDQKADQEDAELAPGEVF